MNSRTAAPMMTAIKAAFEQAKYRSHDGADIFLNALHESGYEISRTSHLDAVPISNIPSAYAGAMQGHIHTMSEVV